MSKAKKGKEKKMSKEMIDVGSIIHLEMTNNSTMWIELVPSFDNAERQRELYGYNIRRVSQSSPVGMQLLEQKKELKIGKNTAKIIGVYTEEALKIQRDHELLENLNNMLEDKEITSEKYIEMLKQAEISYLIEESKPKLKKKKL